MGTPPGSTTVRPRALTIPWVTLVCSPRGLPIAMTMDPRASLLESPKVAGCSVTPFTLSTARSSGAKEPSRVAAACWPSGVATDGELPEATTWLLVTTSPWPSNTTPEPSPPLVWMSTTLGSTLAATPMNAASRPPAAAVPVAEAPAVVVPTPPEPLGDDELDAEGFVFAHAPRQRQSSVISVVGRPAARRPRRDRVRCMAPTVRAGSAPDITHPRSPAPRWREAQPAKDHV